MSGLDRRTLRRFLDLAGDRLTGDWVVIGGIVLPLLGVEHRVTVDIDVAGPEDAGTEQTLALLGIAEDLGLPVEAINQAAAFFLRRIPDWREHVVAIHRGRRATIHVPDATLFVLLKLSRLTDSDLGDCLEMLRLARRRKEPPDAARLRRAIRQALRKEDAPGRKERLGRLLEAVEEAPRGRR